MAFMGDQIGRLLNRNFKDANELARELYALFSSNNSIHIDGPVHINVQTPAGDALIIHQNAVGPFNQQNVKAIQLQQTNGTQVITSPQGKVTTVVPTIPFKSNRTVANRAGSPTASRQFGGSKQQQGGSGGLD
jgi:hypothetical protein